MRNFGEKIARKRKDLGMTQEAFAEQMSVSRQTVSRWESGTVLPDIDKVPAIAGALGVSCDYLLNDDVTVQTGPAPAGTAGRLLRTAKGQKVRFTFYDEEADLDLYNAECIIEDFEGNWLRVTADTRKGRIEKLIPLSSVLSLSFVEEAQ